MTLAVDLSTPLGPVTHAASGSLYGITETLPGDVDALIAPLRPNMFTNPAADVQQPVGDAIVVAGRLAPIGARVTIRLADWLKGFYTFTSMSDWFDKLTETVRRRKAAGLTNIYAYEIWNEPNGTYASGNPLSFNEFWRQSFTKLRELDPEIKITGPSLSYYNESWLSGFLSFCKTNACLPDIVGWHELGGGDLTKTLQAYRALEKRLGVGPLPISINEYSGAGRVDVEGQPGASAPLIAKFERFRVDSACISYWDVAHAGRLGSLLATNTEPNGGWWFYKWYGEMRGNMVMTTAPNPSSATALDGFANLDTPGGSASVVFGGTNDGVIKLVVSGFGARSIFGTKVQAVVERTAFVNRATVVKATDTLSRADLNIVDDRISVSVTGANATDGYRLRLTPFANASGAMAGSSGTLGASAGGSSKTTIASGGTASGGTRSSAASVGGTTRGIDATDSSVQGGTTASRHTSDTPRGGGGTSEHLGSSDGGGSSSGSDRARSTSTTRSAGAEVTSEPDTASNGCGCHLPRQGRNAPELALWATLLLLRPKRGIRTFVRQRPRERRSD